MPPPAEPAPDGAIPSRVFLRPIGTALPLGFLSFAIGMLLLGGLEVGWVAESEQRSVGVLIASFVFPLELLAAVMAFLGRDGLAATVLGLFATSWLAQGILDVIGPPGATSHALGLFLLGFATAIGGATLIAAAAKPLFALVLTLSTTRSVLAGLYQLIGSQGLERAAGVATLALAVAATYTGLALLLEDSRSRAVLPVLRRGPARAAFEGAAHEQIDGVENDPGVRSQL